MNEKTKQRSLTGMHQLIKPTHIDFLGKSRQVLVGSGVVVLICLLSLTLRWLNLGLDFTGGTLIEVGYPAPVDIPDVRELLAKEGFGGAQTQHFGTSSEVLIRIAPQQDLNSADISGRVLAALQGQDPGVEMRRVEFVGPKVGDELIEDGGLAMLYALICILIYVTLRFEWRLALGTIAAIVHDVIFTLGIFSLFQIEFDLTVLAAVLAVIGYSVNDSVVVLDRIRENFRKMRKGSPIKVMNASINQTLARTVMTSLTTLLAVVVLFFFGGPAIRNFALALIIGILIGTYSSIYVASSTALLMGISREDLLPRAKEEADDRP
jgi:preprotein translocase subunit SecF